MSVSLFSVTLCICKICNFQKSKFSLLASLFFVTLLLVDLQVLILKRWCCFFRLLCVFVISTVFKSQNFLCGRRFSPLLCDFVILQLFSFNYVCRFSPLLCVLVKFVVFKSPNFLCGRRFFLLLCVFVILQVLNLKCVCRYSPILCYL